MRPILLDSERKSQRTRSGVAFEDSARSREPLHGIRSSRATSGVLRLDVKMRSSKGRDLLARRDHTPKETRSDRDPCRDRSWLLFAIDSDSTHIPFRPPSARQRRREKSGTGPSNPRPREEPFPGPTGPAPRVRAPRIPRKRLRPGSSEPEPAGAQYAPDTVFRAPCTARVIIGNHGARPRRDGLGCLTSTEFSHQMDSDGRPTCRGRGSGEP